MEGRLGWVQSSSEITAVVQVTDVGSVYKGGGDDSRGGRRWARELTEPDDGLHVEVWGVSKARCPEWICTQQRGWWYHSPRKAMLAEGWVWQGNHECGLGGARLELPFRLPGGDPEMCSGNGFKCVGTAVVHRGCWTNTCSLTLNRRPQGTSGVML